MRGGLIVALLLGVTLEAQEPVAKAPDALSYGTALVNPAVAAWKAAHSPHPKCELARLGLSAAIGNAAALTIKHFVVSPRPCLGCDQRGLPSSHAMNSVLGVSHDWRFGVYFSLSTAQLRTEAHRHTPWQVAAGLGIGALAELAGQKALACR